MLWDLNEGKHLYTLDGGDSINNLCFSPNRYWLCAATGPSIKIWVCTRKARGVYQGGVDILIEHSVAFTRAVSSSHLSHWYGSTLNGSQ